MESKTFTAPKISILVLAQKNSKYLSNFLFSALNNSNQQDHNIEVMVMLSKEDNWNKSLMDYFDDYSEGVSALTGRSELVRFYEDDKKLGEMGQHNLYNRLAENARGQWFLLLKDTQPIIMKRWDEKILQKLSEVDTADRMPVTVYLGVDNTDKSSARLINRAAYEAMDKKIARHGWVDEYLDAAFHNSSATAVNTKNVEFLHDYFYERPDPMDPMLNKVVLSQEGMDQNQFDAAEIQALIAEDNKKITARVEEVENEDKSNKPF